MPVEDNRPIKVEVKNLTKRFGDLLVLDNMSFNIRKGEFVCVVGPTGCGKSTFLNCLTRIHMPSEGDLFIDGVPADPRKHNISFVFQEPSALPWMTVEENIGYGIYNVSIQDSGMPRDDVSNAFKAVEDAKQGMETAINTAKKYQSENIPKANAEADKLLQDAEAYKQQRINEANGQVARFEDTYAEYVKYPLITKKRMFYETMEELLPDLKVIIDNGSGTQTMLPLEPFANVTEGASGNQTPQAAAPAGQ